jgi:hypothetical protein
VEKSVENSKPVEKKEQRTPFPLFHRASFSTACGKVENNIQLLQLNILLMISRKTNCGKLPQISR